jgi:CheY-like chemotaxis protein
MEAHEPQRLRKRPAEVDQVLDSLEAASESPRTRDLRQGARFRYRIQAMRLEAHLPSGETRCYLSPTRNISRLGLSALIGHFVYPGTTCGLHLATLDGRIVLARGTIVRCRYLLGTGCLHEIGIQLAQPVDLGRFSSDARTVSVLLVDADPRQPEHVERLLSAVHAEILYASDALAAEELVEAGRVDLVLVRGDAPDGTTAIRNLRALGLTQAIVAYGADTSAARNASIAAGASAFIETPLQFEALAPHLPGSAPARQAPPPPTATTVPPAPDARPQRGFIPADAVTFLAGLGEHVAALDSELRGANLEAFAQRVAALRTTSRQLGLEQLAGLADELTASVQRGAAAAELQQQLAELVRWCQAAESRA